MIVNNDCNRKWCFLIYNGYHILCFFIYNKKRPGTIPVFFCIFYALNSHFCTQEPDSYLSKTKLLQSILILQFHSYNAFQVFQLAKLIHHSFHIQISHFLLIVRGFHHPYILDLNMSQFHVSEMDSKLCVF